LSTIGQSSGWITLGETGTEHLLVYNPRGAEHSIIEMQITKPENLELSSFVIEIEFIFSS
jgi:hypothetical protein